MSIDMSAFLETMLTMAGDWFNALIPIFGIVIGISLGIGLLYLVFRLISNALPHG
jgi:formate-dependent nitrite reductase membrane component NrfD